MRRTEALPGGVRERTHALAPCHVGGERQYVDPRARKLLLSLVERSLVQIGQDDPGTPIREGSGQGEADPPCAARDHGNPIPERIALAANRGTRTRRHQNGGRVGGATPGSSTGPAPPPPVREAARRSTAR